MSNLLHLLNRVPEYEKMKSAVSARRKAVLLTGLGDIHRAHFLSGLLTELQRPLLIVTRDDQAAGDFSRALSSFLSERVLSLPGRELIFHNIDNASREYEHRRIGALHAFLTGGARVMVSSPQALMLRTIPKEMLKTSAMSLKLGESYEIDAVVSNLLLAGYIRSEAVEGPGQFALRGGILDIFTPTSEHPVRAEFFGDEIDSMGLFDKLTQRRFENVRQVQILPVREVLLSAFPGGISAFSEKLRHDAFDFDEPLKKTLLSDGQKLLDFGSLAAADRYFDEIYPFETALDYLPSDTIVAFSDTPAILDGAKGFEWRMGADVTDLLESGVLKPNGRYALSEGEFSAAAAKQQCIYMDSFMHGLIAPDEIIQLTAKQLYGFGTNLDVAVSDMQDYLSLGYLVYVLAGSKSRAQNLIELLSLKGVRCVVSEEQAKEGFCCVLPYSLPQGFEYTLAKVAVLAEGGAQTQKKRQKAVKQKNRLTSFTDISKGDLVVHEHHGIGRFVGVERISVDGVWRDYMKIAFLGSDFVFVPSTALNLVSKYIGGGDAEGVRLSKLGSPAWAKAKQKAKGAAKDLAEELIKLYSARQNTKGVRFPKDDDIQLAFEDAFPYDETDDQLLTASEIKADMQKPYPMDRLLCGDVGFGKTEVAFRAVMKCILGGYQAAILVPTTVLARQHYLTALSRFSGYPVEIAVLSRFTTPQQVKKTLSKLKNGQVDLIIGTHRILQKDIGFSKLGLLVVDEEQRFGVAHKEQIKKMSVGVDVLTLSATPIPRTLNMALSNIRDMSLLEEAPLGRYPVQTYVLEHDDVVIRDAIRREFARGGKVYYLFNRIDGIERCAARLRADFKEARIEIAHGRMGEEELSGVMARTYAGEVDILVCTTIIETGIDIPDVNTLIIEDADRYGLAQLHQIRGRVGRGTRRASAYLTYRRGKVLSEIAQKRLTAIREFAEFGSGFKIAMRDLEIRGAGNILGAEQSGHMQTVGYEMYLRLLNEASREIQGEDTLYSSECLIDIPVSAGLPERYISDAATRIDIYRRTALIGSDEELLDMSDELTDRFGDLPKEALALLDIAKTRAYARAQGVSEISFKHNALLFTFEPKDIGRALKLCSAPVFKGRMLLNAGEQPYLSLKPKRGEDLLALALDTIKRYSQTKPEDDK